MKMTWFPKSILGKWAVGLSVAFIILIMLKMQVNIHLSTFFIATLGLVGFVASILSVVKDKDRAILNFLPILVGSIIIFWSVAEIIYPH